MLMLLTIKTFTPLFFLFTRVCSISIGSVSDAIYLSSNDLNQAYSNLTCMQCSCLALRLNAVGWNCNDQCQMIMNYSQNDIGLVHSSGTTYSFLIIPPQQSTTTTLTPSSSSTSATTVATTTTVNFKSTYIAPNTAVANTWTLNFYSYRAMTSTTVTVKFTFQTASGCQWYIDDVSVRDAAGNERLINGNFEASSSLSGWSTGYSGFCTFTYGSTSTQYHSTSHSYYSSCSTGTTSISQSFAVTGDKIYNVSFWVYFNPNSTPFAYGNTGVNVTIN
ncbi:unnamed protein product [Adineta ricciae]|uniref:Uncharacterized protein n=1 Tax=Adineta ricciae TaxID=249248 RepID=A0A814RQN9_ADIRI|nr:unnamed protein product [Adineta ricciae]CAF1420863.1 unnamed protein product [Adineta ricciae]